MFTGFQTVEQGESHKEKNLPCQDAAFYKAYKIGGIIAVADGHGSEKHFRSDAGSACAVDTAYNAIFEFNQLLVAKTERAAKAGGAHTARYSNAPEREDQIEQLERTIITRWRNAMLEHYHAHPLSANERALCAKLQLDADDENTQIRFYGTTLLAALFKKDLWFALQIGDGKCVIIDAQGKAQFPPIDDEALGFGKTTSLCDSNAAKNFRHIHGVAPIKGITVATDGVSDSFIPDAYLEFHEKFYADLRRDTKVATEGIQKAIGVWAANGSRDDAAMAGIFDI